MGGPGELYCGLGIRAGRAGSIGRDRPRFEETTESLQKDAGGLGPRPLHEEITPMVPSGPTGAPGRGTSRP